MYEVDYLTGLYNRSGIYEYFQTLDKSGFLHALFLDLDNFKSVNDIYGHSMGDQLLIAIANMLKKVGIGFICRMGGDEFVILMDGELSEGEVQKAAQTIMDELMNLDFRKDILTRVTFSIGIVLSQKISDSLDDILYKCDTAMYQAKEDGKNCIRFFDENSWDFRLKRHIEQAMDEALEKKCFESYIQPQINLFTSQLSGGEILSRWNDANGTLFPEDYMAIFENNGFIVKLDFYMFEEMCKMKSFWKGTDYETLPVSINMSRLHLYDSEFIPKMNESVQKYGLNTSEINLEFDEVVLLKDVYTFKDVVIKLKEAGYRITIDNFNVALNALTVLKDLPVDSIKIDKSFLLQSFSDFKSKNILNYTLAICFSLKLEPVIVGVSTEEQVELLMNFGARVVQGEYFAKPMKIDNFNDFAKDYKIYANKNYHFTFDGHLKSEDGEIEGTYIGDEVQYQEGLYPGTKSIYFPGGAPQQNVVDLPPTILMQDSYTISMWIKPTDMHLFIASLFIKYNTGFTSFYPLAWEGNCSFRSHLDEKPMNWYDASGCAYPANQWTMFTAVYNAKTETSMLYCDGIPYNKLPEVPTNHVPTQFLIGGDVYQPSFVGNICELRIFNEAMDEHSIRELYSSYVTKEGFTDNHKLTDVSWI